MEDRDENRHQATDMSENTSCSRREAIKRIGILGLGLAMGSGLSRTNTAHAQPRPAPCYRNNCYSRYASINEYSPGPPYTVYNRLNTYSSICYYSCSQ